MQNNHYYVPAGMPPGVDPIRQQEGPPAGVYYYRIYAAVMVVLSGLGVLGGMVLFVRPLLALPSGRGSAMSEMIVGLVYGGMSAAFFIPLLITLFGGRRPWVHTLATILIAFSMTVLCCMPIALPLLITWLKPETKRWYSP